MQIRKYRSLGFTVEISTPSTVEENDQLAGKPGATLESGVDNVVYRGGTCLPLFRERLAEEIEKATGIKRNFEVVMTREVKDAQGNITKASEPKKDADGNEVTRWTESEQEYLNRILAQTGRSLESFADQAAIAAKDMVYDPKAKERSEAGPKTPPKGVYEQVDALIAAGRATEIATALTTILGRQVEADRESLARAIHEDQLNEIRKAKSKFAVK